jgi:DNA polymerase I-like protein with 3'-5' exonuclease and polymerase domains
VSHKDLKLKEDGSGCGELMVENKIGAEYLGRLQAVYHKIDSRGILVSEPRLKQARKQINSEIHKNLDIIKTIWGCHVYIGADNDDGTDTSVNLNSSSGKRTPLAKMKALGYDIPKVPSKDEDGNYVSKESLAELVLQKMLSTNQFGTPGGDPVIKSMLSIRELVTLKNRYINANLFNVGTQRLYLTNYNAAGTTTGRRSSRKHTFGFGNNAQNFPKHGILAKIYRRCLIARPGKIFLMVDQMQAEDWPVSALANNLEALHDLSTGVDRHKKLAMAIFNLAADHYTEKEWKDSIERYLGKKTRHANNYGMRGNTMSDSLAKEGQSLSASACQSILDKTNAIDPSVQGVFHKYVEAELYKNRILRTPFGRERQFFGLRPGDNSGNQKIFREAYSHIPQSTVGDNTGFAVYNLEWGTGDEIGVGDIIQEGHDSIVQEKDDNVETLWNSIQETIKAFDREIKFHNGITLKIPVEGEIGYDFYKTVTFKNVDTKSKRLTDLRYKDVQIAYNELQEIRAKELEEESKHVGAETQTV